MKHWDEIKDWEIPKNFEPTRFLSIIIPARNEAKNIAKGLRSISANNYPKDKYEIILIDDHSDDETYQIASTLNIPNLQIVKQEEGKQGKKQALKKGISLAKGEIVLTTDADCQYDYDWLSCMVSFFENHQAKLATGPIAFAKPKSFLEKFQALDLNGLMSVTASGIQTEKQFMANGANMMFSRTVFDEVGGYRGNEHLASGDDMFLIHKFAEKYPEDIFFVKAKEALVTTEAEKTLSDFLNQRKRWATKTKEYTDGQLLFTLALVFVFSVTIVLNIFLFSFFNSMLFLIGLFQLSIKLIVDYVFLADITKYFGNRLLMDAFLPANIMHLFYICYSGITGLFGGKYVWKGRKVS